MRELPLLQAELARRQLLPFILYTHPDYRPNWHHVRVAHELDGVLAGTTKRLMLFMPPQHGKSELASRYLVPLALGQNPDLPVVFGTYNADRATEVSRDVQRIIMSPAYRTLFPRTRLARGSSTESEIRQAAKFTVVGRQGIYQAAGVGQGISGKSMLLGIVDDPIAGRAAAESETERKRLWDWYVAEFTGRQMTDEARIVVIQTRWHEDDLAGRLLRLAKEHPASTQWRVVSFPAICEMETPGDPRKVGEALWPSRFSAKALEDERILKGTYDWSALYQQRPVPPGGAMAQRAWFKVGPPRGAVRRRCRCWDLAGTKPTPGRDPDWTVGAKLAEHLDGTWTVEHVVRVRTTAREVDVLLKQTAVADGAQVLIREWQDPGAAGKAVIEAHRTLLAGYDYGPMPSSGEKSLRWRPFFVQAEAGNVWLVEGSWNQDWLDEMSLVPYAIHDDQADAVAGAFLGLTQYKDFGPAAAVIMPGTATVSGPARGDWQEQYFRR